MEDEANDRDRLYVINVPEWWYLPMVIMQFSCFVFAMENSCNENSSERSEFVIYEIRFN